jgi:hypothetical protein
LNVFHFLRLQRAVVQQSHHRLELFDVILVSLHPALELFHTIVFISIQFLLFRAGIEGFDFRLELIDLHVEVVEATREPLPYLLFLPLLGIDL